MNTQIHVRETDKDRLDSAKEDIFGTTAVPYRTVIERLIEDHDDVESFR